MTVPRRRLPLHVLLLLLVGTVTAFAAAWQPSYERAATLALAQGVAHEEEQGPLVTATAGMQPLAGGAGTPDGGPVPHLGTFQRDLDRLTSRLAAGAGPRLGAVLGKPVTRVSAVPATVADGGAARPYGLDPELQLVYAQDAPPLVRYVAGRAPARPAGDGTGAPVEVALSEQNRQALGLELGRTFRLDGGPRLRTDAVLALCGERTLDTLPCALDLRSTAPPQVTERLSATALAFQHRSERTDALRSFALAGLLAVAAAAALAAARLAVRREDGALALQRARGASPGRTGAARLAETAPAVLLGLLVGELAAALVTAPR
ncbi:hypothetical protein ACFUEL_37470, partial [Kitasatospora sp. NPDC057198]